MIEASGLTKLYGNFQAISNISFSVASGEIVGLLGPNGAGKSTTMRILACILSPTSGVATISGHSIMTDSLGVRRCLGYMPENVALYPEMEVGKYLHFVAKLKGLAGKNRTERVSQILDELDLGSVARAYIGTLSKGYRQRVGLGQALLHNPEILILDEPTIGLDPEQASGFRDLIRKMRGHRTVILSTHILPEVRATCDRVMILASGQLLALDTPGNLTQRLRDKSELVIHIDGPPEEVKRTLAVLPGVHAVQLETAGRERGNHYTIQANDENDLRPVIAKTVTEHRWDLLELRSRDMDLEEIFRRVVDQSTTRPST